MQGGKGAISTLCVPGEELLGSFVFFPAWRSLAWVFSPARGHSLSNRGADGSYRERGARQFFLSSFFPTPSHPSLSGGEWRAKVQDVFQSKRIGFANVLLFFSTESDGARRRWKCAG
jgi:hypothetical protein